jgi:hypothetical protein
MACVNPNAPEYREILERVGNPLLAELEYDRQFPAGELGISDELSLYLADQMQKNFGITIPITNPDMLNLVNTREVITQTDIDEKKLEC